MTEELTVDDISMDTLRRHLRDAGKYALIVAVLIVIDSVLSYLREVYQVGGYLRLALLGVSVIIFLATLSNALAALSKLDDASGIAWRMERLRNVLAVSLVVTSAFLAGVAYVHYTGAGEPFADRVDAAQDERQSALESAAAADDPDVVDEHMEAASAAESESSRYEMYNRFWRFFPTVLGGLSAVCCFLIGLNGLFTSPRPEVTHADV